MTGPSSKREPLAALLVVTTSPAGNEWIGRRIGIFPGGPTPMMFPAASPFWIGYGFIPAPSGAHGGELDCLSEGTRFELDVDGERVSLTTDLRQDGEAPVRRTDFVSFPAGLPAGWHEFVGRWYDGRTLILSSRASIEFVES